MREKHINFILEDTQKRGETIVSGIKFFGALYQCKVKIEGRKTNKTVNYSAADNVLSGYRAIVAQPDA